MMGRAPSLCGVILAAGESSRMGRDKALLPWPPRSASGETFLSAAIQSLNLCSDMVIVVAGKNEENLSPVVYANGAFLVRNPEPERGQFSSMQVGVQEVLNRGRDAAIVTLVDRPAVRGETLATLRAAFEQAVEEGKWAVIPAYGGKRGHPIIIGREMIEAILRAPATSSAREVRQQNADRLAYVAVEDAAVCMNVNTAEDYGALGDFRAE